MMRTPPILSCKLLTSGATCKNNINSKHLWSFADLTCESNKILIMMTKKNSFFGFSHLYINVVYY